MVTTSKITVSVNIPTLNSQRTLGATLASVRDQTYEATEVIVVDNGSSDGTVEIATGAGASVLRNPRALLESRCMGVDRSRGDCVLLLDSDQVLTPTAVARCVEAIGRYDYLFLEEGAIPPTGRLQRLYQADRLLAQDVDREVVSASHGISLPRFFRTSLLKKAIHSIPQHVRWRVIYRDHAVLYFEIERLSRRSGWIAGAVDHQENSSYLSLLKKHALYGKDDRFLERIPRYRPLVAEKRAGRLAVTVRHGGPIAIRSLLLTALKAFPYAAGYWYSAAMSREKSNL